MWKVHFPKLQILDSSKLKELADDNFFKFDENGRKFSKQVENAVGKGDIDHYEQYLLFPTVFSKDLYCRHVKKQGLFGRGLKYGVSMKRETKQSHNIANFSLRARSYLFLQKILLYVTSTSYLTLYEMYYNHNRLLNFEIITNSKTRTFDKHNCFGC